ncbi:MAG: hypothetical protein HY360_20265 [Verrucomicrobia bacterium]|nr:hypothetical protein [Verrucomicrobiota bacterium]
MPYTIAEARHRFSLWAACRAAQAGFAQGTREQFTGALNHCKIRIFLENTANHSATQRAFDQQHHRWVSSMRRFMMRRFRRKLSYGVAAKLISIYIKSFFILGGFEQTQLAQVAHPPIDSILLKGVDRVRATNLSSRYKWKKLTAPKYRALITKLRALHGEPAFWKIEEHWVP